MRIRVDPARCQGHNRCISAAPDLFDLDGEGYAAAVGDGTVPPHQHTLARLAVDNCPEEAISIDGEA
jgi:ferredoxin